MNLFSSKIALTVFVIALTAVTVSCSKKISFLNSAAVPAARGFVKVKKDKNHNYVIQVELNNLAEVERLQPARKGYVVWMETAEETVKNIGQIKSATRMLSSKLNASFHTVSAVKPIKIYITAEDEITIQYPENPVVLTTDSF